MTTRAPDLQSAIDDAAAATRTAPPGSSPGSSRLGRLELALAVSGGATALLTALDGPQPWPLVRGLLLAGAVGAVHRVQRLAGRSRAAVFAVVGLVATAYGAGYGAVYALKDASSVSAFAGMTGLLSGLVLLVGGVARLLRATRWWTKLVSIPSMLAITFVLGAPIGIGVAQTNVPPLRLGDRTPASVGLDYDEVELTTADGVDLDAWYVPSTNGAAVVLLAGAGSVRSDEVDRAAALARHGYGVLLLDVRGHGGSGGEPMLLGWYGELDVRPAVDWLLARREITEGRVGVVGMSMGGQQAVAAAGDDPRIGAVVADGVVGRHSSELDAPTPVDTFMGWLSMETAELLTAAPHPVPLRDAVASSTSTPFLMIAAERVRLEQDFADVLRNVAPDRVEVWVAPDSGHTGAFREHPAEWERRVVRFLDESL